MGVGELSEKTALGSVSLRGGGDAPTVGALLLACDGLTGVIGLAAPGAGGRLVTSSPLPAAGPATAPEWEQEWLRVAVLLRETNL